MVKEIVSLISFPLCLFLVYRNATEVRMLILYPAPLLKAADCHSWSPTAEGATFPMERTSGCVTLLSSTHSGKEGAVHSEKQGRSPAVWCSCAPCKLQQHLAWQDMPGYNTVMNVIFMNLMSFIGFKIHSTRQKPCLFPLTGPKSQGWLGHRPYWKV